MGVFDLQASAAVESSVVGRMGTDAHIYDNPEDMAIPALLDSRFDADKVDALKRLLAQSVNVAHLFPQVPGPTDPHWILTTGWLVVKNTAAQSLEGKKLDYLYLLH